LIIISGPAQVGKTALAHLIAKEAFDLGLVPKLMSFADPLKKEAISKGYSKEEQPLKYREYCQEMGAIKRELDPDYWVNLFEEDLQRLASIEKSDLEKGNPYWERCVIVDDCRYQNEVGLGLKYNATMVFLSPGDRELPMSDADWRNHHSEALANAIMEGDEEKAKWFDYHILNDDNMEALKLKAKVMSPIWTGVQASSLTFNLDSYEEDEDEPFTQYEIEELLSELIDKIIKDLGGEEDDEYPPDNGSD